MKKHFITTCMLMVGLLLSSCEYLEDVLNNNPGGKPKMYSAFLSGDQEVPAVDAQGAGQALYTLNAAGTEISFKLLVANTDKIKFAHIHLAPKGENGPVVAPLLDEQKPSTGLVNGVLAEGKITAEDLTGPLAGKPLSELVKALENGTAYTNIHTDDFPNGELRGQIRKPRLLPSTDFATVLTGSQEVPPVDTDATGAAALYFNASGTELSYRVDVTKLDNPLFSHIHIAPVGENGPVVVTLKADKIEGQVNGKYAEGKVTAADLTGKLKGGPLSILKEAMESGHAYVNIHTDEHKPGEIRGQIQ